MATLGSVLTRHLFSRLEFISQELGLSAMEPYVSVEPVRPLWASYNAL